MSLFENGAEVYTITSFVISHDLPTNPCGHTGREESGQNLASFRVQFTNCVKNARDIAECPTCGATWDDQ